jgi:hypothetical protein
VKRSAAATLRNREPIAEVLQDWLPDIGTVLEIASGTGEHALFFASRFRSLAWQPSDADPAALDSISAWLEEASLPNIRPPVLLDAAAAWPKLRADAVLCINMAHISGWQATLGLLEGAGALLPAGAPLIFYGPWYEKDVVAAPSNLEFDQQLRARNPSWGIRNVEDLDAAALDRGFERVGRSAMPANNIMLLLRRAPQRR